MDLILSFSGFRRKQPFLISNNLGWNRCTGRWSRRGCGSITSSFKTFISTRLTWFQILTILKRWRRGRSLCVVAVSQTRLLSSVTWRVQYWSYWSLLTGGPVTPVPRWCSDQLTSVLLCLSSRCFSYTSWFQLFISEALFFSSLSFRCNMFVCGLIYFRFVFIACFNKRCYYTAPQSSALPLSTSTWLQHLKDIVTLLNTRSWKYFYI